MSKQAHKQIRFNKIVLNEGGAAEKKVSLSEIHIPDLWHAGQFLKEHKVSLGGECCGDQVINAWHNLSDLKKHIQKNHNLISRLLELLEELDIHDCGLCDGSGLIDDKTSACSNCGGCGEVCGYLHASSVREAIYLITGQK